MTDPQAITYPELPRDLAEAQAQAIQALQAALQAGYQRVQIEILAPDLKPEVLARPFLSLLKSPLTVFFSDAGAAALAQREWKAHDELPEQVILQGLSSRSTITAAEAMLFVIPAVTTVEIVEQLCNSVSGQQHRPIVLLNPQLQDAATVGVGLAGRRLRDRFINTIEPCYYLRPLATGALLRLYPHPWIIWQETSSGEYEVLDTRDKKPSSEELAKIFASHQQRTNSPLEGLRRFLQALQN